MKRSSSRTFTMASTLVVALLFLVWWWWPRPEAKEPIDRQPLPVGVAPKNNPPRHAVPGKFEEVKLPDGEIGYAPRLTPEQNAKLEKGGVTTMTLPGGGSITIGGTGVTKSAKSK